MKKLFFVMAAVAALLTSCSKDDTFGGPTRGKVTFEVSTPELATRYGEGTTATALQYAVYDMVEDATNGKLVDTGTATLKDKHANVSIDLVEGRKYTAIFWADAGENASPYTFTPETKTVSYTNVNDLTANNEAYDAFYAFVPQADIKVGQTVNVTLTRPFAQLNIATSDKVRAEDLDVIVEQTAVEVQAHTTLNLVDGTVSGEQTLKFALADDPNFQINVPVDNTTKTYDVLSTNYLLVNTSENVDVTFTFTDKVGDEDKSYVRQYSSIPVERNHRTNVIGSILTDKTDFSVTVDQNFEDDNNENVDNNTANNNTFGVATAAELQAALDAATNGATIYFTDDITGDVTATQKPDVKITILGQGRSLKGAITVDGKSNAYPTAGLTIKDVVFNAQTISTEACINLGVKGDNDTRYINNLTVEGCTFDVSGAAGIKSYSNGDKNLTIIGCTATDKAHSLLQVNNVGESLIIKDCVANSKNGINLNQTPKVDIDNFTANVRGYAVRFGVDQGGNGTTEAYSIKNSSLTTNNTEGDAVIVIRQTADNSTLTIENTTINGTKKIENNATNAIVYIDGKRYEPNGYYIEDNTYNVINAEGFYNVATTILTDANNDGAIVKLTDNIDLQGINWPAIEAKAGFTLDGNGKTISNLTANTVKNDGFDNVGMFCSTAHNKSTIFKNLIVDNATVTGSGNENSHGAVLVATPRGYLTIEHVKVTNSTVSNCDRSAILTTYLYFAAAKVTGCVVEKCTIDGIGTCGAILGVNNGHNFEMTNNQVIDSTITSSEGSNKAGIFIGTWQDAGTLTETNNTHSGTKAINAGVETNNTIGRHK